MVAKRNILLMLAWMLAAVAFAQQGNVKGLRAHAMVPMAASRISATTLTGSYTWEFKQAITFSTDLESLETVGGSANVTIAPSTKNEGGLTITGMFPNALEATVVSNEGVDYLFIAEGQIAGTEDYGDYVVNGVYYYEGDDKNEPGWYFDDIYGLIHDDGSISFDRHWFYRVLSGGEYGGKELVPYVVEGSTLTRTSQQEVVTPPQGVAEQAKEYVMSFTDDSGAALSKEVSVAVDGNDVYLQGMSKYFPEAWVKGTKNGNQVTFPAKQYMGKRGTYGVCYFFYNGDAQFTYNEEADTYSSENVIYGMLADVYYDGYYKQPVLQQVDDKAATPATPKISAVTTDVYGWYMKMSVPSEDTEGQVLLPSKLAYQFYVDEEHYITTLTFTPETHIKLTEEMSVVPYGFTDNYDFFDTKVYLNTLYSEDWNKIGIQSIYTGGGEEHRSEISWFTLKDYDEGGGSGSEIEPEDPIEALTVELPYSNDFSSAQQIEELVIIDANGDGNTWGFSAGMAFYSYSSDHAANDWLVAPQMLLKAGHEYHVSLKAAAESSSYPEKFEVKAALEATCYVKNAATLMSNGLVVIPATKVSNITFNTFENNSFTVMEDGYYNIGVHVISPALMWVLTIKDFLVEEVNSSGISTVRAAELKDAQIYNLNGQRVEKAHKGLHIVNGKKVAL